MSGNLWIYKNLLLRDAAGLAIPEMPTIRIEVEQAPTQPGVLQNTASPTERGLALSYVVESDITLSRGSDTGGEWRKRRMDFLADLAAASAFDAARYTRRGPLLYVGDETSFFAPDLGEVGALSGPISAGATSLALQSPPGVVTLISGSYRLYVTDGTNYEFVTITGGNSSLMTCNALANNYDDGALLFYPEWWLEDAALDVSSIEIGGNKDGESLSRATGVRVTWRSQTAWGSRVT